MGQKYPRGRVGKSWGTHSNFIVSVGTASNKKLVFVTLPSTTYP